MPPGNDSSNVTFTTISDTRRIFYAGYDIKRYPPYPVPALPDHGRLSGRGPCGLCLQRGRGHLPHHSLLPYGGVCGRMGRTGQKKHLRTQHGNLPDAVRGRRGFSRPRRASGRFPGHYFHRFPGTAAHAARSLPHGRGAAARRHPCGRQNHRHPCPVHLRRPFRHLCLPTDRRGHFLREQRAGSYGSVSRSPSGGSGGKNPFSELLRRLPHLP